MTENNVWFITGAGRGMGVDVAQAALAAGHRVVATARDAAKAAAAVGEHENLLTVSARHHRHRFRRRRSHGPLRSASAASTSS